MTKRPPPSPLGGAQPPLSTRLHFVTGDGPILSILAPTLVQDVPTPLAYRHFVSRTLQWCRPLEALLDEHDVWATLGLDSAPYLHVPRLERDLFHLNVSNPGDASPRQLPDLPTVSHGLGAAFVLGHVLHEGPDVLRTLSEHLYLPDNVTHFLRGAGKNTDAAWTAFRRAFDAWGDAHPHATADVEQGARATMDGLGTWCRPHARDSARLPVGVTTAARSLSSAER